LVPVQSFVLIYNPISKNAIYFKQNGLTLRVTSRNKKA